MDSDSTYMMFKLKNKEFTFDVDVSNLPCGLNGALYFVEMDQDGGLSKFPNNKAGAKYGTGYCDAQCPHDLKFINGEANCEDWKPSPTDKNAGVGKYGTCCTEMDIWEANVVSTAYTPHVCTVEGQTRCSGEQCGDNASGDRYHGVCDRDGCDSNPFRLGNTTFYGSGSGFQIDTTKKITVVTQFITSDNTDSGELSEIRRVWVQDGKVIQTPESLNIGKAFNSVTDNFCSTQKNAFGDPNDFATKGGLQKMGAALDRGMVLVMSLWDDHDVHMLWLDSDYPLNKSTSTPGVARGTCATSSGDPNDVEKNHPDASVTYSNIKVGEIGSTYPSGNGPSPSPPSPPSPGPSPPSPSCPGGSLSACIALCPSDPPIAYKDCVAACVKRCPQSSHY